MLGDGLDMVLGSCEHSVRMEECIRVVIEIPNLDHSFSSVILGAINQICFVTSN